MPMNIVFCTSDMLFIRAENIVENTLRKYVFLAMFSWENSLGDITTALARVGLVNDRISQSSQQI